MKKDEAARPGRGWAWFVLLLAGGNQLLWNLWHSISTGMPVALAVAFGVVPPLLAMGLSEIVARAQAGRVVQGFTFVVMLGVTGISVRAQYEVLMHYLHDPVAALGFPLVGDIATLLALYVVIVPAKPVEPVSPVRAVSERSVPDRTEAGPAVPVAPVPAGADVPVRVVAERSAVPAGGRIPAERVPDRAAAPVREPVPEGAGTGAGGGPRTELAVRSPDGPRTGPVQRPAADRPQSRPAPSRPAAAAKPKTARGGRTDEELVALLMDKHPDGPSGSVRQVRNAVGCNPARAERLLELWRAALAADQSGPEPSGSVRDVPDGSGSAGDGSEGSGAVRKGSEVEEPAELVPT